MSLGIHGLPLMGTGDWNDGMNRVGSEGRGESIWLGWFLYNVLDDLLPLCDQPVYSAIRQKWQAHQVALKQALEQHGWDGEWYRRAYFDDGAPLGSAANEECRIDSIVQSWAVLSGAGDAARTVQAMDQLDKQLAHSEAGLLLLITPPFQNSTQDPGYIKGYQPGVRENGGQYTHAAIWSMMAFAKLGNGEKAYQYFKMLNPIQHSHSDASLNRYKVEPYVLAGDIYSGGVLEGRGGWSWYTGSAAWYYRAGLESLLGFRLKGDRLKIEPCIPPHWKEYEIAYQFGKSRYTIQVKNPEGLCGGGATRVELNGQLQSDSEIHLVDDGNDHTLVVTVLPLPARGAA